MKIGVITLPLRFNYGGILQASALQYVLREMGHNPVLIQRRKWEEHPVRWRIIRRFLIEKFYWLAWKEFNLSERFICKNTYKFIDKYIPNKSPKLFSTNDLRKYFKEEHFDALIVGSDQVWSSTYSPDIMNFFLDFAEDDGDIRRIAYSASFGENEWKFDKSVTAKLQPLAKKFDGISVRESSGVGLCERYLGVKAIHVLDPTMLLSSETYLKIATLDKIKNRDTLCTYILDNNSKKEEYVKKVCSILGLEEKSLTLGCKSTYKNYKRNPQSCVWPSVEDWLANMFQASYIITDSFHGTVFSILFHRPFVVFRNKRRGQERLDSLLKLFNLQDRMVSEEEMASQNVLNNIDWDMVEDKLNKMRKISIDFLVSSLSQT